MSDTKDTVLVLRTCLPDMRSTHQLSYGFVWPESGPVECADWNPSPTCGHGLHGLLWGEGRADMLRWEPDSKWLVVEVATADVVQITEGGGGKVKFPRGVVVHCGSQESATSYIRERAPLGTLVHGVVISRTDASTLTGGYGSTLTGGYGSTLTGGDGSTLTGGARSTLTGGDASTLTGGYGSTLTGGDGSTLTGGDGSTLTGGDGSQLCFRFWDGKRWRSIVSYVGEDGIEPNVPYKLDPSTRKPMRVDAPKTDGDANG